MFKKTIVFSVAVALMLMGLCSVASAAQNVANTSQKGSLLVYPWINTNHGWDTIIVIANDNTAGTTIKCLWMDEAQEVWNFEFPITANQPVWFRASDGMGSSAAGINPAGIGFRGELKCFAITFPVDPTGDNPTAAERQIAWNHLYGSAILVKPSESLVYEYPAWAFTARNTAQNGYVGPPGEMTLSGASSGNVYDACPAYNLFNFFAPDGFVTDYPFALADNAYFGLTRLALSPCQQDMRQEREAICTKAKFDVWNENERKLTGAYHCVKCWYEGEIQFFGEDWDLGYPFESAKKAGFGGANFTYGALHTPSGRARVTGISGGNVCAGVYVDADGKDICPASKQKPYPITLVKMTEVGFALVPFGPASTFGRVASTGSTAGTWSTPTKIFWDAAEGPQQAQAR